MAVAQVCGTDNVPINVARPNPAVIAAPRAPPWSGKSHRNAAALLSEFRCVIATPDGALSELSFDSGDVTAERGASNVVSGDNESARSVSGMVVITWWPADTSSGADFTAQVTAAPRWAGPTIVGGEVNGVIVEASAEAPA